MIPKTQRELKLNEAVDSGKTSQSAKEVGALEGAPFIGDVFRAGSLVASSSLQEIDSMNEKGQYDVSNIEKKHYSEESFCRARAQMTPSTFSNLPLSTKSELQKQAMSTTPSSEVNARNSNFDLRDTVEVRNELRDQ